MKPATRSLAAKLRLGIGAILVAFAAAGAAVDARGAPSGGPGGGARTGAGRPSE